MGATTAALFPPSSSNTRPNRCATRGPTCRPIRTEPVAVTSATRGSSTSRSPTSRPPMITRHTAGGAPTSSAARWTSAWQASAVSGVSSEGFHTTVSPHTSAIAAFQDHTATGKLNAVIDADHAQRMPGLHQPVARPFGGDGAPVELARQPDREPADVDHLLHFAERLGDGFAGLDRHQRRQLGLVLDQQFTEPRDKGSALRRGRGSPRRKRLSRFGDRGIGTARRRVGDGEQHVAGDRGAGR